MLLANPKKTRLTVTQSFLLLLLAVLLCTLPSCKPKSADAGKQTKDAAIASKKDLSQIKVGYCTPSLNAPFYVALSKSIQNTTEGYGMKFISVDGQGDIAKQITAVEDLVAKGINILVLNPLDSKALVPTVNQVVKSGIPVFIVDSYIEPSAQYITSILANNQGNGEMVGEWIADKLGKTKIKAAIISGAQGSPVGREKRLGFIRGIAENQLRTQGHADLTIVSQGWGGWSNSGGLKAMEDILASHPEINVLMAENDAMALGALKALNEAGKANNVLVVGFDGQKEALELIKQGKYEATALNSPMGLGKLAVESVVKYLNGDKNLDKVILTPPVLISVGEVNKFYDAKAIF
jgi:ribose transport system substrate-binding protein